MILDRSRVGEEARDRDERSDGGENTQQREKGDTGRDSQDIVLVELLVSPPQNVFPAAGRDLLGTLGVPARTLFSFATLGSTCSLSANPVLLSDLRARPCGGALSRGARNLRIRSPAAAAPMVLMREDEELEDDGAVSVVIGLMSSSCVGLWRSTNPALVEFLD